MTEGAPQQGRTSPAAASTAGEPDWFALEAELADFAQLVKTDATIGVIGRQLLERLVDSLDALGAAYWTRNGSGELTLRDQINLGSLGEGALGEAHHRLLTETLANGRADVAPSPTGESNPGRSAPLLILAPYAIESTPDGLVEVIQRADSPPEALEGAARFTSLLAELVADGLRRRRIGEFRGAARRTELFTGLLAKLHASLNPREVAAVLANDGRPVLDCGRVSVALRRGGRYRLAAVSAVDEIHRRSASVRLLEKLISRAAATGQTQWFDEHAEDSPPQLQRPLAAYLDESHARYVAVAPLFGPDASTGRGNRRKPLGAMVVEGFDADRPESLEAETDRLANHAGVALANAVRYRSLPTLPLVHTLHKPTGERSRLPMVVATLMVLAGGIASTFFIETDYKVFAQGELQPVDRRHVFAPLDGQVKSVKVTRGQAIATGQPMVELVSPDLELEIQKVRGEHEATRQRQLAIEAALLEYGSSLQPDMSRVNRLSAEQEELRQVFASQERRLAVLREQRQRLVVVSPLDGEVLTWEAEEELVGRPVRRGDRLLTVANLTGEWHAELRAADDDMGPLLNRWREAGNEPLSAVLEIATKRGEELSGEVSEIGQRVELDPAGQPVVRMTMKLDGAALEAPRPGATVYAAVDCGRRSLFYVWCHDLVDQARGWFRF
ncbi:MAG: efflux RND transporter periplasmic adaptor subunit [Planctomycetota bacterium]